MAKQTKTQLCKGIDELAGIVANAAVDLNTPTNFDFAVDFDLESGKSPEEAAEGATGWYGIREIPDYFDCDGDYKVLLIGYFAGSAAPTSVVIDRDTTVRRAKRLILEAIGLQFISGAEDMGSGKVLLKTSSTRAGRL